MPTAGSLVFPQLDALIARFEGFTTSGSVAQRNNNPGNIIAGPFARLQGSTGSNDGFATFDDPQSGFAAMDALVQRYATKGYSIADLMNAWAPGNAPGNSPESTQNYINFVASGLGKSPNTPLSDLADDPWWKKIPLFGRGTVIGEAANAAGMNPTLGGTISNAIEVGSFLTNPARLGLFILGLILIAGAILVYTKTGQAVTDAALQAAPTLIAV